MARKKRRWWVTGNPNHCWNCGRFCDDTGGCDDCYAVEQRIAQHQAQREKREQLGQLVRAEWLAWAEEQPDVADHPHWLTPWGDLAERNKEVDRRIGERLYTVGFAAAQPPPAASEAAT
ncbi:MAG: hypothetical protein H0X24_00170 [Ktedonobacterales bacterium]|nr:hypothetical protein [Ktedonobacterales bacterium]